MPDESYERGRVEGEIRERLSSHDRHFEALNGQLIRVESELHEMTMAVTRVTERQQAILDTTSATHEALRQAAERRWSRWQKIFAVVAAVSTVIAVYVALRTVR